MMRVYGDGVVWRARALALLGVATLMPPGCREGARPGGDGDGAGGGGSGGGGGSSSSSSGRGEGEAATSGASSGVADTDEPGGAARITWHQDIAVIVARRCGGCHTSGGIAPFSLQTYAEAGPFAAALLDAVERRSMPPFLADSTEECEPRHGFRDDPRLRDAELELLRGWVEDGAPEGDATTAAPLPKPPVLELEDADIHVQIPGEVTVESGEDLHICSASTRASWRTPGSTGCRSPRATERSCTT